VPAQTDNRVSPCWSQGDLSRSGRKGNLSGAWITAEDSGYIADVRTLNVCPVAEIAAPLDEVWSLLVDPYRLDLWWNAKLQSVRPAGTMVPGQVIDGAPHGFKKFHVGLAIKEVNHSQHRLSLVASLPLGITDLVTISCMSLDPSRCRVSYG
jgi:hypothetical protein